MDRARDSGSPRATRLVYVLTEPPEGSSADLALGHGFAVYLPVYDEAKPAGNAAERRTRLEWVRRRATSGGTGSSTTCSGAASTPP